MKVYLVVSGEYSDFRVRNIFTDKELAQKFCDHHNAYGHYYQCEIQEWETDVLDADTADGLFLYEVTIGRDGTIHGVEMDQYLDEAFFFYPNYAALRVNVKARDKEHAIKIAIEKRQMLLANGAWKEVIK